MQSNSILKLAIVVLLLIVSTACTTMKPMEEGLSHQQIFERINPGDKITIYTTNREKHLIVVDSIDTKQIVGGGKTFKYEDIVEIRQQRISALKTGGAVLGGAGVVIILLVTLILTAMGA